MSNKASSSSSAAGAASTSAGAGAAGTSAGGANGPLFSLSVPIGIDIGAHNSRVAVWANNRPNVVANPSGERETPSVVAFTETETLIGITAVQQEHRNTSNTITGSPALLGLTAGSPGHRAKLGHVFPLPTDAGVFVVAGKEKERHVDPRTIVATLAGSLKETAETFLGRAPTSCVVSIPVTYSAEQRDALLQALADKHLHVLQLLPAPLAAAVAMDLTKNTLPDGLASPDRSVMFIDIGMSMEVSMVKIVGGLPKIDSWKEYPDIGGALFDQVLVDFFASEFYRKTKLDLKQSRRAMVQLRAACRQAKITLSNSQQAAIAIDSLYEGQDFHSSITRGRFEGLMAPAIAKITEALDDFMKTHSLELDDITDFVLLGGCGRIPKLEAEISNFLELDPLPATNSITSDEVAVCGCAHQAFMVSQVREYKETMEKINAGNQSFISDVAEMKKNKRLFFEGQGITGTMTTSTVGFRNSDNMLIAILPRGSLLPAMCETSVPLPDSASGAFEIQLYKTKADTASNDDPDAERPFEDLHVRLGAIEAKIGTAAHRVARIRASAGIDGALRISLRAAGGEEVSVNIPVA